MPRVVLFEDHRVTDLLPLLYWRTVFELRCGRISLYERVARWLGTSVSGFWTRAWFQDVAAERCPGPVNRPVEGGTVLLNGRWVMESAPEFRDPPFVGTADEAIAYVACDDALAGRLRSADLLDPGAGEEALRGVPRDAVDARMVRYPWDLVTANADALTADWQGDDRGNEGSVDSLALLTNADAIHIGAGSQVRGTAAIDATDGPVYISEHVLVHPQAVIRGPAYIGPGSIVNPHADLHGGSTIGPMCKVGGEIDACIICGYSNKQHSGFLGHSYVGCWVNLGADTVNSDLKNTYGTIRVPINGVEVDTGLMFVGAVIADHVKTGINQAIPTGGVIGFASVTATTSLLPRFVPSFSWITEEGAKTGDPARLCQTARVVMARRRVDMTTAEEKLFGHLPELARGFEKQS